MESVSADAAPSGAADPYYELIVKHWPNVLRLYRSFEDRRPVMLFDIQEARLYALPCKEFSAELSERSQASLADHYQEAIKQERIVVFVRDNDKRKLVSYSLP